jgi:oxygen-independent coproporphyrinogen-3 oxidase
VSTPRGLPLSLYVHLPWCVRKCPYCDFNSHAVPAAGIPRSAYLAALLDDLEFAAEGLGGREICSVFFGGGTPSLFAAEAIAAVLRRARQLLPLAEDLEVTLEANPGTVEHGAFAGYRDAGVTRVSLGAQSFDDRHLASLGRIHAHGEIEAAVAELRAAGLANFNLDLMYGLPRQTLAEAVLDLERAVALAPRHISHYQLTLEPGTAFEKRPPDELPDDETTFAMQGACQDRLAAAGYRQYEVSAYAQPGGECRHNLNYWSFGDYVGIGAGAHGKTTDPRTGEVTRTERVKQPGRYLAAVRAEDRLAQTLTVAGRDLPFEFFLNALRLADGFDAPLFEERTGLPLATVSGQLLQASERGLVEESATGRWAPTRLGRLFLNDLQACFLPGSASADSHRKLDPRGGSPSTTPAAPEPGLRKLAGAPVIHTPDADA